eukprot:SAG11_NODE_2129_length_3780_cov_2.847324_2_plen_77_part_00
MPARSLYLYQLAARGGVTVGPLIPSRSTVVRGPQVQAILGKGMGAESDAWVQNAFRGGAGMATWGTIIIIARYCCD